MSTKPFQQKYFSFMKIMTCLLGKYITRDRVTEAILTFLKFNSKVRHIKISTRQSSITTFMDYA